jgi:hypothetical protein
MKIDQGILQRLLNVGTVSIATAGVADVEIVVEGMRNPERIKRIIEENRYGGFSGNFGYENPIYAAKNRGRIRR